MEHLVKVLERVLDQRLRKLIKIDDMQFGFSSGNGITDAIFVVQMMQEKFREKDQDLNFTFVDLEKAYDMVPRELVYWCFRKRNVKESLIILVKATYMNAQTVVRTSHGETGLFKI